MKIFLDVGAYNGETLTIALKKEYEFDTLYAFEPVPRNCRRIRAHIKDPRVQINEFGLWHKDTEHTMYDAGKRGASLFKDKFRKEVPTQEIKLVKASEWFRTHIKKEDTVYLKLNCEGAEYQILNDLIHSGEYKKIDVLMVDFDIRKIPSQKHLVDTIKKRVRALAIPQVFFIDEYELGPGTHKYFTNYWLTNAMKKDSSKNIMEGVKTLKGTPVEIPDCSRDDLPQFFVDMGFKVGVEIGVDRGEFSQKLCEAGLALYAVDPWGYYPGYEDSRGQEKLDQLYENTKRLLTPYPHCKIVRKTSVDAAADFADESLDFVYIDGNHEFTYVAQDIGIWIKKIKKGGVIAGHDYIYTNPRTQAGICHVIYVVDAYTKAYKVKNWYLLGRKHKKNKNEKRDKFRSWMWIKDYKEPFYPIK